MRWPASSADLLQVSRDALALISAQLQRTDLIRQSNHDLPFFSRAPCAPVVARGYSYRYANFHLISSPLPPVLSLRQTEVVKYPRKHGGLSPCGVPIFMNYGERCKAFTLIRFECGGLSLWEAWEKHVRQLLLSTVISLGTHVQPKLHARLPTSTTSFFQLFSHVSKYHLLKSFVKSKDYFRHAFQ